MSFKWAFFALVVAQAMHAQTTPEPDVIVLADGERLVGQFERSNGATFAFKSDMLGEINVPWDKVQEFHSSKELAVIPKGVLLSKHGGTSGVAQGVVTVNGPSLTVVTQAGAPQTVPAASIDHVIPEPVFSSAMEHTPGFFHGWAGTVTAGASLVEATQESRSFTGAINLVRLDPAEDWLERRNRTLASYIETYGIVMQPNTSSVKTSIYHAGFERDEYFSPSVFVFGSALFDHNFSQGLTLQQTWGGGFGWSVIRRSNENFDLKAGVTYINQDFATGTSGENLIASVFEEDFRRVLKRGMIFTHQLIANPAWNETRAFSATGNAALTLPVYKRMGSTLGVSDGYLNNPPPGFKHNSFQFTAGLTYALR